jgi:hypothetical protein
MTWAVEDKDNRVLLLVARDPRQPAHHHRGFLAALLDGILSILFSLTCANLADCFSKPFTS